MIGRALRAPLWLVQGWLAAGAAYLLGLLGFAAVASRRPAPPPAGAPPARIAVLVPAHNEQAGIATAVGALLAQQYPPESRRVVVIADNCSDATAAEARRAGAEVLERHDAHTPGKGPALGWAIDRLWRQAAELDMIAVVDADCIATPRLLSAFSDARAAGAAAVQADYRVSNPGASAAAARRWAGFALRHAVRGRAKAAAGLSCGLFGTGMAFRADVLRAVPWTSHSITEDAEHHARLVQAGHVTAFAPSEAVLSAMPTTEAAAQEQQMRWESGNAALARATVPRLLRRGAAERDIQLLHLAAEQLVPPQSLLAGGAAATLASAAILHDRPLAILASLTALAQVTYVVGGLALVRAPASVWRALATAPASVYRKLLQTFLILTGRGSKEWVRTQREAA